MTTELKNLRLQAKLSQQELALASGLSEKAVSMIENQKVSPTLSHWYKLQRICLNGVKAEEFNEYRFTGDALYRLRTDAGMSQKGLEKALLLPATIVSAWETGKKMPSLKALQKICVFFAVRPDYFFIKVEREESAL